MLGNWYAILVGRVILASIFDMSEILNQRLRFFTWKRMVLRFFYPLWVLVSSKKKMDALNERNILEACATNDRVTIFLHGIASTYYFAPYWIVKWFTRNGIHMVSLGYDYNTDLATAAQQIRMQVDAMRERYGVKEINIVGVSLGGVVGRYYDEALGGNAITHKLITIFSPIIPPEPGETSIALSISKLLSRGIAEESARQNRLIKENFSVDNYLAIYGTSDWIVGKKMYPLKQAPGSVRQVPLAGGHLLVTYNTDAAEVALEYLQECSISG